MYSYDVKDKIIMMLFKAYGVANRKKLIKDITTLTLLFSIYSFSILLLVLAYIYAVPTRKQNLILFSKVF